MRNHIQNAGGNHASNLFAGLVDVVDLKAQLIKRVGNLDGGSVDGCEVSDPGKGCAHKESSISELIQESNVVVPQQRVERVDFVAEQRDAVDAKAEGEP